MATKEWERREALAEAFCEEWHIPLERDNAQQDIEEAWDEMTLEQQAQWQKTLSDERGDLDHGRTERRTGDE